ncbi:hypothetical protein [Rhizomonospora bruguierae]|uniref:hypothetical protein n=1 Tax=Rhizomonospora bruguierae TaxID=1581705 RepID=UPI001BCA68BF|nr:hypothetical protein [Micromonospora sp. NBRC 107566]
MSEPGAFADWLSSGNWVDYRQRRELRELDSQVSALTSSLSTQARESSRLRSRLSYLEGSLEERMRRLTRAFDAFVELSDLRVTLSMFDPPALVRHRARQVAAAASDSVVPALPAVEDVPGYWLPPALRALVALLRGEEPGADLATALDRDARRSALLIASVAAVAGRPDIGADWIERAFPPLRADAPVTRAQRMLWTECLCGRFGDAGVTLVTARLAAMVEEMPAQQRAEAAGRWAGRVEALPGGGGAPGYPGMLPLDPATATALSAAGRLEALRKLCESGTAPGTAWPEPAPAEGGAFRGAGTAPERDAERIDLGQVLRALVDEGSEEEAPLLRRAADLRAVIEDGAGPECPPWGDPAGTGADLLLADAFHAGATPLGPAARRAGAAWLLAAAEPLAARAALDAPATTTLEVAGGTVTVDGNGAVRGLEGLLAAIDARYGPEPGPRRWTVALAAGGVVLFGGLVFWPRGLAVLATLAGVALLVAAGVRWRGERVRSTEREVQRGSERTGAERRVAGTVAKLTELRGRLAAAGQGATADLAAIRSAVAESAGGRS